MVWLFTLVCIGSLQSPLDTLRECQGDAVRFPPQQGAPSQEGCIVAGIAAARSLALPGDRWAVFCSVGQMVLRGPQDNGTSSQP